MKDEKLSEPVANVREGGLILRGEFEGVHSNHLDRLENIRISEGNKLYWTQLVYSDFKL